jgi:hypothetical protein
MEMLYPSHVSLFDETLTSFIDQKKPIEKGKGRNKKGGPTFKNMIALKSAKSHFKGAKREQQALCLKPFFSHEKQIKTRR